MELVTNYLHITGIYLVGLIGVLAHYLKKEALGQTKASLLRYFQSHFNATLLMLLSYTAAFFTLIEMGQLTPLSAILTGFTADSVFNKTEEPA